MYAGMLSTHTFNPRDLAKKSSSSWFKKRKRELSTGTILLMTQVVQFLTISTGQSTASPKTRVYVNFVH